MIFDEPPQNNILINMVTKSEYPENQLLIEIINEQFLQPDINKTATEYSTRSLQILSSSSRIKMPKHLDLQIVKFHSIFNLFLQ